MAVIVDVVKGFVGKLATNVTTGVTTGLIVTFITTYVLVDLKKDRDKEAAAADSAKTAIEVAPPEKTVQRGATRTMRDGTPGVTTPAVLEKSVAGGTSTPADPGERSIEKKASEVRALADSAMKELDQAAQGKESKPEEAAKPKPTDVKPKQVELKKDVKDVRERADDVFDELDKEVEQTPVE